MSTKDHASTLHVPRKLMGTPTLALMVVAMASPVGVVVGTVPLMIGLGDGVGTPGAFVLVGAVLVVFAFGYAAMAEALPAAGGFFGFIRAGLGGRAGLAAGFIACSAYAIITGFVAALLAYSAANFFRIHFDLDVDWIVWGLALLVLVTALMWFGVKESAQVTAALLMLEFAILTVLVVSVLFKQGPGAFPLKSFSPTEVFSGSPGFALALAFLCFVGFEVTAVFTSHVRDPEKTIGRSTMIGLVILIVTFGGGAWAALAGVGPKAAVTLAQGPDAGQLVPTVASNSVGDWMGVTFEVTLLTSLTATLIVVFNTSAQYTQTLACTLSPDGFMARSHPKHGSPANTGVALAVLIGGTLVVCRLADLDPYVQLAGVLGVLGAVGIFMLEIACALAIFVYFRRAADRRVWTTMLSPIVACTALTVFLIIVLSNFGSLTGSSSPIVTRSPLVFVIVAVLGWVVATVRPDRSDAVDFDAAPATVDGAV